MSHKAAKIGVTSLVLLTAFGVLLYTTLGESMQYYKYVDEVVAQPATWKDKNLQVHGHVVPGSIGRKRDSLDYRFEIQRNGSFKLPTLKESSGNATYDQAALRAVVDAGPFPPLPQDWARPSLGLELRFFLSNPG